MDKCIIEVASTRICPDAEMRFALSLYLSIERDAHLGREHLAELFWPDFPDARARHSLRHLAYVLRSLGFPLNSVSNHLFLSADAVWLDYEDALGSGPSLTCAGRGFLPGYAPTFSPGFSEWLDRTRCNVHSRLRVSLLRDIFTLKKHGRWAEMAATAQQCLSFDPFNEEATLALAEATALSGNKLEAVCILDRYAAELGSAPSEIRLPATLLRRRITERLPQSYSADAEGRLIGREQTLSILTNQLHAAQSGKGTGSYIWGRPGIGKSRIVLELMRVAAISGVRIQRAIVQRTDASRPLSVFCDTVRGLLDLPGALGCAPHSRQYLARLSEPREPGKRFLEELQNEAVEAPFVYAAVKQSVLDLVDAVCEETTLLLVVEDAHWIDSYSAELIRELVRRSPQRRLMVLLAARNRPRIDSPLSAPAPGLFVQELLPLSQFDSAELFVAVAATGSRAVSSELVDRCTRLAEGNPYFLRELAAHCASGSPMQSPPDSIVAALEGRLSRLPPESLRVLQVCALLGKHSTLDRLERVLDIRRVALVDALEALDTEAVLTCDGEAVLAKHDLLSEAAIAKLSVSAARFIHLQIGKILEADLSLDNYASLVWDIAEHFRQAGNVASAVRLMARCADHALRLGSAREAIAIWDQARQLSPLDRELQSRVDVGFVLCLRQVREWHKVLCVASASALQTSDTQSGNHVHDDLELAILEAKWFASFQAEHLLPQLLSCVRSVKASPHHKVEAGVLALMVAHNLADVGSAEFAYQAITDLTARSDSLLQQQATAAIIYHTAFGDLATGANAGRQLVEAVKSRGDIPATVTALRLAAVPLVYGGGFSNARQLLTEAVSLANEAGLVPATKYATEMIVRSYFEEGDYQTAKDWLELSSELLASTSSQCDALSDWRAVQAQIALLEGRPQDEAIAAFNDCDSWAGLQLPRFKSIAYAIAAVSQLAIGEHFRYGGDFQSAFTRASTSAGQDFAAFARYTVEARFGQRETAVRVLRHYIDTQRRERSPLPAYLRKELC